MVNVLSLFDGISCGRVALDRVGIPIANYFASEIDKYAITIAKKNYPDNVLMGDVKRWRDWALPKIGLLIGGSPCQGFSISGKRLNFDDPRSQLFFDYADILDFYKPKYFMLENVVMKKECQDVISKRLGCQPIKINSGLFSAQNRIRLYWTNIPVSPLPMDKGIVIADILEPDNGQFNYKQGVMRDNYRNKNQDDLFGETGIRHVANALLNGRDSINRISGNDGKSPTITAIQGGGQVPKVFVNYCQSGQINAADYCNYRYLSVLECERLQTLPDNYTAGVSDSQRYKAIGNGFNVDTVAHIVKGMLDKFYMEKSLKTR